ncbi:hypothetical protein [Algoriphagus sanaruensis]|uniref:Uncharacterized protein n=1 Tax=Algoriphagus sanaruensis TaxID=1727163 RepID=A0A142ELC7_9BACT|nr:hypothetical protein [Algoriphagus sanaruensis]AMQ55932.1 hypothetical protein AO498_05875 [Algoriphagus sanaruensis]
MKNRTDNYLPIFISIGMFVGIGVGIVGAWMTGDSELWIPLGTGGGIAFGSLMFLWIPIKK